MIEQPSAKTRYRTLDAWRAIAALSVVAFHCAGTTVTDADGWWAWLLLRGWAGVFVFFPVSGYCIASALARLENASLGDFLRRRWRRIMPPYWASIAFTIGVAVFAVVFTRGSLANFMLTPGRWVAVLTLTQGLAGIEQAINPVYWSLCYEEQFYLLMALVVFLLPAHRAALLVAVTAAAGAYATGWWPAALRVEGLFLEHWIEFACGLAAFAWLRVPGQRPWAVAILAIAVVSAAVGRSIAITLSLAVTVAIIATARFDARAAASTAGKMLISAGAASYSLYLVHQPIGNRIMHVMNRAGAPFNVSLVLAIAGSAAAAAMFYLTVERRFLNRRSTATAVDTAAARPALAMGAS
jgi:peptidoglycan/LPS O-acetylase OafA/YrhL